MKNMRCPVLLIHGGADDLIPCSHSEELFKILQAQDKNKTVTDLTHLQLSQLLIHKHMTHNDFNLAVEILDPIEAFVNRVFE